MRRPRAFTLSELAVVVALFGLFSTTALASLNLTLGHWRAVSQKVDALAACRFVTSTLASELRQGIPNPAGTTGYRGLSPEVGPTAVLNPNAHSRTATEVVFTEPDPVRFDPLSSTFVAADPRCYRRVRYYVSDGAVRREVRTWTATGTVSTVVDAVLARVDGAALRVRYQAPDLFDLEVVCTRGRDVARLTTQVYVLGR